MDEIFVKIKKLISNLEENEWELLDYLSTEQIIGLTKNLSDMIYYLDRYSLNSELFNSGATASFVFKDFYCPTIEVRRGSTNANS